MNAAETNRLDGKLVTMIAVAVVALVAVVVGAFVLSFDAITAVSKAAHVAAGLSWLMPVSVDGAMTVGTMSALVLKMLKKGTGYAWFVVLAGVAISVACNALHATQSNGVQIELTPWQAGAVSAIPAVALALSLHLLIILIEAISDAVSTHRKIDDSVFEDAPTDAPQVSVERLPAASVASVKDAPQTPPPLPPTTLYRPPAEASSPAVSAHAAVVVEDAQKDAADAPQSAQKDVPGDSASAQPEPPRNTVRTPARRASARPAKASTSEVSTRDKAVLILTGNRDISAADLARELGLEPSGYVRTLRRDVLAELAAEDAGDSAKDGGGDAPEDALTDTSEDGSKDAPEDAAASVSGRRLHAVP
ncbi:DUF2637 domain-containing protein [Nonomuraea polychroma]|uniref:DUF2637 domain-containing protein n=1 Tax=Nonomuraea polychroma TaxID=46176 RepID=UPI003D949E28